GEEDVGLRGQRDDDLVHEGLRLVHGRLGGHLHVVAHLEQRSDDHEDDQQHEDDVHERRDVDVALVVGRSAGRHRHQLFPAPFCFLSAIRPTFWKPASLAIFMTSLTSAYFNLWSALMMMSADGDLW